MRTSYPMLTDQLCAHLKRESRKDDEHLRAIVADVGGHIQPDNIEYLLRGGGHRFVGDGMLRSTEWRQRAMEIEESLEQEGLTEKQCMIALPGLTDPELAACFAHALKHFRCFSEGRARITVVLQVHSMEEDGAARAWRRSSCTPWWGRGSNAAWLSGCTRWRSRR